MMNIELNRKDFILAMIFAYLLIFAIVIPLSAGWSDQSGMFAGLLFGAYSLIFGLPVMFAAALIGYPIFRCIFGKLHFKYLINVLVSCACVSVIISFVAAVGFIVVFGERHQEFGAALMIMGIPTIVVGLLSGVIFWFRTK
ncbi:hypothetical protein MIB92_18310 [Aestuariirhabdus sp. Z084]|uniref:hypothetical protein n=1 Tax=Aestuariirhabdus haliotis TaxID=2918751 RepID=UPI00201B35D4|nr:hypothetical protein [Aestuariirhabdus haliotis]MCL6417619.1 hypothetical protein [Aestuariirhabdus haliotis]MCL6421545.1 hypothetical protein [Aestuariirhabdus haliotis]